MVLLAVAMAAEEGGVKILNATSLKEGLEQNHQVLLYLSQEDCKHCE